MAILGLKDAVLKLPALGLKGEFSFDFDCVAFQIKKMSWKRRINIILNGVNIFFHKTRPLGLPATIQVEPTNDCNLGCPLCPSGSGLMSRPRGYMRFELFKNILDEIGDYLVLVILFSWGEPFMNRSIYKMISYAKKKGIIVLTSSNGHYFEDRDRVKKLIDSGIDGLIVALDGTNQQTFERYRRNGNFHKVVKSVRLIMAEREKSGMPTPFVNLRMIIMKQNEDQIEKMKRLAQDLNVDMLSFKSATLYNRSDLMDTFIPIDNRYQRYGHFQSAANDKKRFNFNCFFPFRQPTVFWDGRLVLCEQDFDGITHLGKLYEEGTFSQLWHGPKAAEFRKQIILDRHHFEFCRTCTYENRREKTSILNKTIC